MWRAALTKLVPLLFPHEVDDIEATIAADDRLQAKVEQVVKTENDPMKLVDVFKPYMLPRPRQGDLAEFQSYNDFMKGIDERVYHKWQLLKKVDARVDFSNERVWLPEETDEYSLGRYGSERVERIKARLADIGLTDFSAFWASHQASILAAIPKDCLRQRVTDEAEVTRKKQPAFLVELAKAIANARGVVVEITWGEKGAEDSGGYLQPDSYFRIGELIGDIEQETEGSDNEYTIAKARGQIVVLGNQLWRLRTRYEDFNSFENEVYGFVGTGIKLQCLRQIHAYQKKVRCYDGPLLQLADGNYNADGDSFAINLQSDAVKWAAAALDRMVVSEAARIRAASQVNKDVCNHLSQPPVGYGTVELNPSSGYWIGDQYLHVPTKSSLFKGCTATVLETRRNNEVSAVLKVLWEGEIWWLKVGPDLEQRKTALQEPDELPTGGWERWFQTERDMLSRVRLGDVGGTAFAVSIAGVNRPAMLVKDAGDSIESHRFSKNMTPSEVYNMSKQVYKLLEGCGKRGVIHGDVGLENICCKDGRYSLIDWGLACGHPFSDLVAAVDKAWPALDVVNRIPGIPNWEMSPDRCFCGARPFRTEDDLESLLYCCMKVLGSGRSLPWSDAACSGTEFEVLQLRVQTVTPFVKAQGRSIYQPLLSKLGWAEPGSRPLRQRGHSRLSYTDQLLSKDFDPSMNVEKELNTLFCLELPSGAA